MGVWTSGTSLCFSKKFKSDSFFSVFILSGFKNVSKSRFALIFDFFFSPTPIKTSPVHHIWKS